MTLNGKATEGQINAHIELDPYMIQATDDFFKAKKYADDVGAMKESILGRSYCIKGLAELYTKGFFIDHLQHNPPQGSREHGGSGTYSNPNKPEE